MSSTISLGIVPLDNEMYWMDEFQFSNSTGSADRAIDGTLVIQQAPVLGGQPMTLTSEIGGWQSRATVQQLKAMEANQLNYTIPFSVVVQDRQFYCVFRHEEAPAVDFSPITATHHPDITMWYTGTIKLRIISVV